ncbi:MAG: vitamin K epoxide reductase family protein [Fimbriimonas sp.]|nr:vitamin K epoxide reductase family protein [Fimbriimonas sp.]
MGAALANRLTLSFASAGLAIASALTLSHASNVPLPCGGGSGCEKVAHDPSSAFMGIPVSVFGLVGYALLILLATTRLLNRPVLKTKQDNVLAAAGISLVGVLVSGGLTWYAVTHIHATCAWCLGSACMMVGSLLANLYLLRHVEQIGDRIRTGPLFLWFAVPAMVIGTVAIKGERGQTPVVDLSSVNLNIVDYGDVERTSHSFGSSAAPIVIAEFGDLMCPACRDMHSRVLKFLSKYPTKVSLLFHHFPLAAEEGHELSIPAAEMSERLDQTDFWSFVNQVYESPTKPTKEDLNQIESSLKGKRTMSTEEAKKAVRDAIALGNRYGIRQTPTYILFIDHKPVGVATSTNLAKVLSQSQFAAIIRGR